MENIHAHILGGAHYSSRCLQPLPCLFMCPSSVCELGDKGPKPMNPSLLTVLGAEVKSSIRKETCTQAEERLKYGKKSGPVVL